MNYLAHAFLSADDPYEWMGNVWGDLLRPKDYDSLHPHLLAGLKRHRIIDTYTDQHEAVHQIIHLLRPYQGKYTPVVVDVLMDYLLSKYWDRFTANSLEDFCEQKYRLASEYLYVIPGDLHPRINRMISHRWLESCMNMERMEETLKMLSRRASFENQIPEAMIPYVLHEKQIDEMFLLFFKELQLHLNLQSAR
jgi:acyl carrier protein phosphodiesterase